MSEQSWCELNDKFAVAEGRSSSGGGGGGGGGDIARDAKRKLSLEADDEIASAAATVDAGCTDDSHESSPRMLQRVKELIGEVDHMTKELLLRLIQVRNSKLYKDLFNERMTAVNFLDKSNKLSYNDYLVSRLRHTSNYKDTAYLNGFYLVSLKNVNDRQLKYDAYEDRFGYLSEIANKYVREKLFAGNRLPDGVRVYTNVTNLRNREDFDVLAPLPNNILASIQNEDVAIEASNTNTGGSKKGLTDRGGLLGLVHFGQVRREVKRDNNNKKSTSNIVVKGFLTLICSSINK